MSAAYWLDIGSCKHYLHDYSGYIDSTNADGLDALKTDSAYALDFLGYPRAVFAEWDGGLSLYGRQRALHYDHMVESSWGGAEEWSITDTGLTSQYIPDIATGDPAIACIDTEPVIYYTHETYNYSDYTKPTSSFRIGYRSSGSWVYTEVLNSTALKPISVVQRGLTYSDSAHFFVGARQTASPFAYKTLHIHNVGGSWSYSDVTSYIPTPAAWLAIDATGTIHYVSASTDGGNNTILHTYWDRTSGWNSYHWTQADRSLPYCAVRNGNELCIIYKSTSDSLWHILEPDSIGGFQDAGYPTLSGSGFYSFHFDASDRPHVRIAGNVYRLTDGGSWDTVVVGTTGLYLVAQ